MDEDRDLLLVAIFTMITIMLWVFFELVQTTKTSTVNPAVQKTVLPLSSRIDTGIVDKLETKQPFD